MPWKPFGSRLLALERFEDHRRALAAVDEAAHEAVRHAREKRDENTARLRLTETRKRLNGWSN